MGCSQSHQTSTHDEIRGIEKYIESISNPVPLKNHTISNPVNPFQPT